MSWDLFNVFYLIVVIYSRLNMLSEKKHDDLIYLIN